MHRSYNMLVMWLVCNLVAIILCACGASQPVRVLPEGAGSISASVGGPVTSQNSTTSLTPYGCVGGAYGLTSDLTLHANLHVLAMAYTVGGIDVGASYQLFKEHNGIPEITLAARAMVFTDFVSFETSRLYPDVAATFSWDIGNDVLAYVGSHLTFQWRPTNAFVSPMVGTQIPLSDNISIQAELMWQAANANTQQGFVTAAVSIGNNGALGGFLGSTVRL